MTCGPSKSAEAAELPPGGETGPAVDPIEVYRAVFFANTKKGELRVQLGVRFWSDWSHESLIILFFERPDLFVSRH